MTDQIKSDINALVDSSLQPRRLPVVEPVGGYPAQRGRSTYAAAQAPANTGGGIASPLKEVSRTYHPEEVVMSLDGAIAVAIMRTKEMSMLDANDNPVVMEFF